MSADVAIEKLLTNLEHLMVLYATLGRGVIFVVFTCCEIDS